GHGPGAGDGAPGAWLPSTHVERRRVARAGRRVLPGGLSDRRARARSRGRHPAGPRPSQGHGRRLSGGPQSAARLNQGGGSAVLLKARVQTGARGAAKYGRGRHDAWRAAARQGLLTTISSVCGADMTRLPNTLLSSASLVLAAAALAACTASPRVAPNRGLPTPPPPVP